MAFVPLAVLGALAGTTTALYQAAQKDPKPRISLPTNVTKPVSTPTKTQPPAPTVSRQLMAPIRRSNFTKTRKQTSRVRAPNSTGAINRNNFPVLTGNGHKLVLEHCEPINIQQMLGAGALSYYTQSLTPNAFPYLNGIASNFGKYRWLTMTIYYSPSCPTNTPGESALGLFYDRQDASAASFVQVTSMQGGVAYPPWVAGGMTGKDAVRITVDCSRFDKPRYNFINTAVLAALTSSDQNNYVPVSYASATQGGNVLAIAGRIWVRYKIEMIDPIVSGINA